MVENLAWRKVAQGWRKVSRKRFWGSVKLQTNRFAQIARKVRARLAQGSRKQLFWLWATGFAMIFLFHTIFTKLKIYKTPILQNLAWRKVAQGWRKVSRKLL